MPKGRPQLPGKRKGKRRILTPVWDYGTERIQERRKLFAKLRQDDKAADHLDDPIGRAWAAGLLENARIDPAVLRDAGRKYAAGYWCYWPNVVGVAKYEQDIRKGNWNGDTDIRGERFNAADRLLKDAGRKAYSAVQSLVLDNHWFPDANPDWVDRLINERLLKARAPVAGQLPLPGDADRLALALDGLMALAGEVENARRAA